MSTTSEGTPDSIGIFNAPTLRPPRRHAARTTPIAVFAAEKRNRNAVKADAGKGALNRRVLKGSESFHRAGKPCEGAGNHHGVHHIFSDAHSGVLCGVLVKADSPEFKSAFCFMNDKPHEDCRKQSDQNAPVKAGVICQSLLKRRAERRAFMNFVCFVPVVRHDIGNEIIG